MLNAKPLGSDPSLWAQTGDIDNGRRAHLGREAMPQTAQAQKSFKASKPPCKLFECHCARIEFCLCCHLRLHPGRLLLLASARRGTINNRRFAHNALSTLDLHTAVNCGIQPSPSIRRDKTCECPKDTVRIEPSTRAHPCRVTRRRLDGFPHQDVPTGTAGHGRAVPRFLAGSSAGAKFH